MSLIYPDFGSTYAICIILGCRSTVAHDRSKNAVSRGRRPSTMFSAQSLWTALRKSNPQSSGFRLFSSTPINEAGYKMKSHSGAKKRWRSLASGSTFKRVCSSYYMRKAFLFIYLYISIGKGFPFAFERHQNPCTEKQVEHDCLLKYCSIAQAEEITSALWHTLMRRVDNMLVSPLPYISLGS